MARPSHFIDLYALGEAGSVVLTAFAILTDGLVYAAYLFLVAVGLTLIFGVMKILNVTHGSFYAFGAYGAATAVGIYFDRGLPEAGGFLFMILLAMAIGLVLGFVLERGVLRFVYGKDEVVIVLVTYACFLMLEDVIVLIWGPRLLRRLSADGGGRQYRDRRAYAVELRHPARRDRRTRRHRGLLGAEIHPLRAPSHRRDLQPRNRRGFRHQRDAWSLR